MPCSGLHMRFCVYQFFNGQESQEYFCIYCSLDLGFMIGPIIGKLVLNVFDYITLCSSLPLSSWQ